MDIRKELWGTAPDGKEIFLYTMKNTKKDILLEIVVSILKTSMNVLMTSIVLRLVNIKRNFCMILG